MNTDRRMFLLAITASPLLARTGNAQGTDAITLTRDGQVHDLTLIPETLGNRSSWDDSNHRLSFSFDAQGPDGAYTVSAASAGRGIAGIALSAPGLPDPGTVSNPRMVLRRRQALGDDLRLQGSVSGGGIAIDFDVTLPRFDPASTPGASD